MPQRTRCATPFRSYDRKVRFGRQRSGERGFDLNADGIAHYGLLPTTLPRRCAAPAARGALRLLFRSTQAYLDTWRRANQRRTRGG